jgi:hypothetical protein
MLVLKARNIITWGETPDLKIQYDKRAAKESVLKKGT